MLNKYTIHMKVYTVCSYVMPMQNTDYEFYTISNKKFERERLVVYTERGWRNVFTTGQAKLDSEDINVWVADNFEILFLSLYYNVITLKC